MASLSSLHKAIAATEIRYDDPKEEKAKLDAAKAGLNEAFKQHSKEFVLTELAFIDRAKGATPKARTDAYVKKHAAVISALN